MYVARHKEKFIKTGRRRTQPPLIDFQNEIVEMDAARQESNRLNIDNIEHPNTKWLFVKFTNIIVKAVLDRQPLLGTGPLPDWLHNLADSHEIVSLNTFTDNLYLTLHSCLLRGHALIGARRLREAGKEIII